MISCRRLLFSLKLMLYPGAFQMKRLRLIGVKKRDRQDPSRFKVGDDRRLELTLESLVTEQSTRGPSVVSA